MKFLKKNIITILLLIILCVGLGLIAYPTFSNYWNSYHQTRAIAGYTQSMETLDDNTYEKILENARAYNQQLAQEAAGFVLSDEEKEDYESQLDINGTGMMGYIEIDKIHCYLPIYHGTDDAVLQTCIGHMTGTSLPVGGESTHCVLSGHRGLPSARLFTDLDQMEIGDTFLLHTLDEVLTYEVDQILIVEPDDTSALVIEAGQDLCTLVTCTPYGVNSHRILVRGHRIENDESSSLGRIVGDAQQIDTTLVATAIAIPILLILIIIVLLKSHKRNSRKKKEKMNKKTESENENMNQENK